MAHAPLPPPALRVLAALSTIGEISAVNTALLQDGALVYVTSARELFGLIKSSSATPDGVNVIAPASSPGRWVATGLSQSSWQTQANWYVDEQNVSGSASDSNAGDSAAAPLASYAELTRRIQFATLKQETTVHLLSDVKDDSVFSFRGTILSPDVLFIRGAANVTLANLTTIAAQNITAGSERPYVQLEDPWDTELVGQRCRVVSSVGATQVGTLWWLEEIDSVDPTICYISQPFISTSPPAFGVSRSLRAAGGDTFVVEELTKCGLLNIKVTGGQDTGGGQPYRVSLLDCQGVDIPGTYTVLEGDTGVNAYGCHLSWAFIQGYNIHWEACRVGGDSVNGGWNLINSAVPPNAMSACSIQHLGGDAFYRFQGSWLLWLNTSFQNFRAVVGSAPFGLAPSLLQGVNAVSFWSWGTGAAVQVEPGSIVSLGDACWGTSDVANTRGFDVGSGAHAEYPSGTPPTVAGALANDVIVGGVQNTYANLPAAGQNPGNNNAWLVARS